MILSLFRRHGLSLNGFWVPSSASRDLGDLLYLLSFESSTHRERAWAGFRADPAWQRELELSAREGDMVREIRSHLLEPTDYSPRSVTKGGHMIFQLRRYTAAPGKAEALNARFRDHTRFIFARHGIDVIGYWTPVEPTDETGDLVYIVQFPDEAAMEAAWASFRADPEWIAAKAESERDGSLTSKVENDIMTPTDYSPAA